MSGRFQELAIRYPVAKWLPHVVVAALMLLGLGQAWRIGQLKADVRLLTTTLHEDQARKAKAIERLSLSELLLTTLPPKDSSYAAATVTVAWNPHLDEGVVSVQNLAPPPAGHDYQLWVLDPKESTPINATLIYQTVAQKHFAVHPIDTLGPGFAVTLEPTGGVKAPTGPILFAVAPTE